MIDTKLYIWILDFGDGEIYRHDISKTAWDPDTESCENFLIKKGYSLGNIEYMVTNKSNFNIE
jgi:hypothetical protein